MSGQGQTRAVSNVNLRHSTKDDPAFNYEWKRLRIDLPKRIKKDGRALADHLSQLTRIEGVETHTYNVREVYELAQKRKDPLLSPHGMFRHLAPRNNYHAVQFLERFGPLKHQGISLAEAKKRKLRKASDVVRVKVVDLTNFWDCHAEFCVANQLYEALDDKKLLSAAWKELIEIPKPLPWFSKDTFRFIEKLPGISVAGEIGPPTAKTYFQNYKRWILDADFREQQTEALAVIDFALNHYLKDRWLHWEEYEPRKFRMVLAFRTLWDGIWELFAWDTAGITWRRCPHCQGLFYPKRKDQFYCNPRQQALASKKEYARKRRQRERRKRRKR